MIISYATPEYGAAATRLAASCEGLGLDYEISMRRSQGNWFKNSNAKPGVILNALMKHDLVLWVDADAVLLKSPWELFDDEFDFCCNSRDRRGNEPPSVTKAYRTGTMAFRMSRATMEMVKHWSAMVFCANLQIGQEPLLVEAHEKGTAKRMELPPEYMAIQGKKGWWFPGNDQLWESYPPGTVVAHHRSAVLNRRAK